MSSVAVAGNYRGLFREEDFDLGQQFTHPYHASKFEAERIVRSQLTRPWRIYRPAVVVGDSHTGEIDKIDGPYYFFQTIQTVRHYLPEWFPLVGVELGDTNLVPVDYVANAIDYLAHQPALNGRVFHLANPEPQPGYEVLNTFAKAAHAPRLSIRIDPKLTALLPKGVVKFALQLPLLKQASREVLAGLGIPHQVLSHLSFTMTIDSRDTERALQGSGIAVPPLPEYAANLWDFWERHLDPELTQDRSLRGALAGKHVIVTGASSGIGQAAAVKIANAGGITVNGTSQRTATRAASRDRGPRRHRLQLSDRPHRQRGRRSHSRAHPRRTPGHRHRSEQCRALDPPGDRAQLRPLPRL